MTPPSSLTATLTRQPLVDEEKGIEPFVTLVQEDIPEQQQRATIAALYRMWRRALSGIPAGWYKADGCPIAFSETFVRVWLDFYVLPSSPELEVTLTSNIGTIGTGEVTSRPRNRDLVFKMSDHVDLDFYPVSSSFSWQTPCWIDDSNTIQPPTPRLIETRVVVTPPLFGVCRFTGTGFARKHRLTIEIDKAGDRITNLQPIITAAWRDLEGKYQTEQLELVVPECVKKALALCDGDLKIIICTDREPPILIYVSECDGSVLDVRTGDVESYCHEVPL